MPVEGKNYCVTDCYICYAIFNAAGRLSNLPGLVIFAEIC